MPRLAQVGVDRMAQKRTTPAAGAQDCDGIRDLTENVPSQSTEQCAPTQNSAGSALGCAFRSDQVPYWLEYSTPGHTIHVGFSHDNLIVSIERGNNLRSLPFNYQLVIGYLANCWVIGSRRLDAGRLWRPKNRIADCHTLSGHIFDNQSPRAPTGRALVAPPYTDKSPHSLWNVCARLVNFERWQRHLFLACKIFHDCHVFRLEQLADLNRSFRGVYNCRWRRSVSKIHSPPECGVFPW